MAGRLRTDGKSARVVTVQLVDNAFRRSSHQVSLNNPTNSTEVIYQTARQLIRQMWPKRPVRLVGITCERTTAEAFEQLDLFTDARRSDKQEKLDRAADALRSRFGDKAVVRARLLDPAAPHSSPAPCPPPRPGTNGKTARTNNRRQKPAPFPALGKGAGCVFGFVVSRRGQDSAAGVSWAGVVAGAAGSGSSPQWGQWRRRGRRCTPQNWQTSAWAGAG